MVENERAQKSRRERNKQEKLERIESAARRLFADKGFEGTTTREIADAADIATGTLFVYFPEKLDLLVHVFQQDLQRIIDESLDGLPEDLPLVESCARVFDAIYDFYAEDTTLARTFVKELLFLKSERQAEMFRMSVRLVERLGARVQAAQARGEVRADVPTVFAGHQLFGLYYWGLVNWLAGGFINRHQLSTQIRMSLDLQMRGLAAKGGN